MSKQNIIRWFQETGNLPTKVNGKEYPNIVGTPTPSGYYKNGFKTRLQKQGDTNYLAIFIYTSVGTEIDIEEKIVLKKEKDEKNYTIYSWRGWNDINLLSFGKTDEWLDMLRAIYNRSIE